METLEQPSVIDAQPEHEAFYRPRHDRVRFTPQQQEAFDKAFRRREAKLRQRYEPIIRDLMDTVEVTQQLLERCKDRICAEDQVAILDGLQAMRKEYGEKQWQKRA